MIEVAAVQSNFHDKFITWSREIRFIFSLIQPLLVKQLVFYGEWAVILFSRGWAIAHLENVRSLFLSAKKVRFGHSDIFCTFFAHFCTFALFERVIVRSHFLSDFWKVQKNRTFEKRECTKMCKLSANFWMCKLPNKQGWLSPNLKICDNSLKKKVGFGN